MNFLSNIYYFYLRKIKPGFMPSKNSLVIDIGSGDKPFWRADVYVDKLSLGNVQRASESATIHDIGTFLDADVTNLPFKDKVFDFSFCCHLLEHVDDPKGAMEEIMRVSKGGYIEIPNGIIESVQPFISHLWFVYINGKKLIFVRKSTKLHKILLRNNNKFFKYINNSKDPFIRLYWKNKIDYEIIDNLRNEEKYTSPLKIVSRKSKRNNYLLIVKILRKLFYANKKFEIRRLLK